jgi:hypothetical protein
LAEQGQYKREKEQHTIVEWENTDKNRREARVPLKKKYLNNNFFVLSKKDYRGVN